MLPLDFYSAFLTSATILTILNETGSYSVNTVILMTVQMISIVWTILRLFSMFLYSFDSIYIFSVAIIIGLIISRIINAMPVPVRDIFKSVYVFAKQPIIPKINLDDSKLKTGLPPE